MDNSTLDLQAAKIPIVDDVPDLFRAAGDRRHQRRRVKQDSGQSSAHLTDSLKISDIDTDRGP